MTRGISRTILFPTVASVMVLAAAWSGGIITAQSNAAVTPACDPDNGGLRLPQGFCAVVVADGIGTARHLAVAANGDVYVALQGRGSGGGIVGLRGKKGDGKLDSQYVFGNGSTTGIALRNGYLYAATTTSVVRYKLMPGELKPTGAPEVLVLGLPAARQHGDK